MGVRLEEETHNKMVVSLNPGTGYSMDIFFSHICCENYNVFLKRLKINEKEDEDGPLKN